MLEEAEDTEYTVVEDVEVTTFDPAPLGLRAGTKRRGWIEAVSSIICAPIPGRGRGREDRGSSPRLPPVHRDHRHARMVTAPAERAALINDIPAIGRAETARVSLPPPAPPAPAPMMMAAAGAGWMVPALPAVALPYHPVAFGRIGIEPARRLLGRIAARVVAPAVFIVLAVGAIARVLGNDPGAASASLDDVRPTVTQRFEVRASMPAPAPAPAPTPAPVVAPAPAPVAAPAAEPAPQIEAKAEAPARAIAPAATSMSIEETPAPTPTRAVPQRATRTHAAAHPAAAHPARAQRRASRGHRRVRLDASDTSSPLGRLRPGRAF